MRSRAVIVNFAAVLAVKGRGKKRAKEDYFVDRSALLNGRQNISD